MSDEAAKRAIELRIQSGEPFTFSDLWVPVTNGDYAHPAYRLADRIIQRYRKNNWAKMIGRRGRIPLWQCDPTSIGDAYRLFP